MAYENDGLFTLTTAEAIVGDRLVKMSGTNVVYCDAGEEPIGLSRNPGDRESSGDDIAIQPLDGHVRKVTGSKAISAGSSLYAAADGKVSDAAVGKQIGILLTAITADGGKGSAIVWSTNGASDVFSGHSYSIEYFDDFFAYDTTNDWAVTEDAGAGTGDVLTDAAGGVLNVGCDGDDNDECYVASKAEAFKFQTDKQLFFEARVKLAEANTDDANIIVGLSDTVGANTLVDDGAGPAASYDGAVFFKVDGGTVWQFETSNAGTQNTLTDAGDFDDDTWVRLGFLYDYNDGTTASVTPYVDGVAGTAQDLTISGLEEMHVLLGVKAGGTNEENLQVDYVHVVCER